MPLLGLFPHLLAQARPAQGGHLELHGQEFLRLELRSQAFQVAVEAEVELVPRAGLRSLAQAELGQQVLAVCVEPGYLRTGIEREVRAQ